MTGTPRSVRSLAAGEGSPAAAPGPARPRVAAYGLRSRALVRRTRNAFVDRARDDHGNALIEFVFVALIVLIPLVYFLVTVVVVQRNDLAVTNAAREAGRAIATADTVDAGVARAQAAVELALGDQGFDGGAVMTTVAPGSDCRANRSVDPSLRPGATFTVCVTRMADLPGVPGFYKGHGITTIGSFEVHVDDFRAVP